LSAGINKAISLADGIYTALFTTVCGLIIAIPSVILAHHFESRIMKLFHEIDEMLFNLLPQVERFEGRVRFNRAVGDGASEEASESSIVGKRSGAISSS
jgi:biopolymer transport protein ExbB